MNTKIRHLLNITLEKIYYYLSISLMFLLSLIMGLGFLSFAGAHVFLYHLADVLSKERYKEKVKIFKVFKENVLSYMLKYVKVSLLYISVILLLGVDLFYFSAIKNNFYQSLFYINLILAFVIINAMILSFFLMAKYKDLSIKEIFQNSLSLVIVNIIDILLLNVLLVALIMIFYKISPVLLAILLPGLMLSISFTLYEKILDRKSITYLLFNIK